ncbi:uncharacterized protein UTRI_10194 [Ustilago trichophora]|uniref:Uncharacterized protein n=1 Tax=Ustilago trichophora TaxID=86804 RepID=A0A5C3EDL7_9BASI|nr:uncharacterized protein UTRI_10194 [Ustilago trichophora]
MLFRSQGTRLLLVSLAFVAVARAVVRPSHADLGKRMEEASSRGRGDGSLTYNDLIEGRFQHDPGYKPSDQGFWTHFYRNKEFVNGLPVYKLETGGSVIHDFNLRQAVADFGGFHAQLKPSTDEERVVTIVRYPNNEDLFVVKEGDQSVTKQLNRIESIQHHFGRKAALTAYGWNAPKLTPPPPGTAEEAEASSTPTRKAPDWRRIHSSGAALSDQPFDQLKPRLDNSRYIRFTNTEGDKSLAVRARPDGRLEHQIQEGGKVIFEHLAELRM